LPKYATVFHLVRSLPITTFP